MKPFWRYYGGKWRVAPRYPRPAFDTIIEPFAGAAGYATRYGARRQVILVDRSPVICGIWRYLVAASAEEILALPDVPDGGTVDDMDAPQEAMWLAGFWSNQGTTTPRKRASSFAKYGQRLGCWSAPVRERIAAQVGAIRHWRIIEGDYTDAPDIEATWFVDPPYSTKAGSHYPYQPGDFGALGDWCRGRSGQVIVCEQEGADWLPFRSFGHVKPGAGSHRPDRNDEAVWTNGVGETLPLFGDDQARVRLANGIRASVGRREV